MFRQISHIFMVFTLIVSSIDCFPDGGPADTCVKPERFNQPNHGAARTQPIDTLPYEVIATTDQYQPGQQIQGTECASHILDIYPFNWNVICD